MINLVPESMRSEREFAKKNSSMIRYLILAVALSGGIITVLSVSNVYTGKLISQTEANIAAQQNVNGTLKNIAEEAKSVETKLDIIQKLFEGQTKFSSLLSDIAAVMPEGSTITTIGLTEDEKTPLNISVTVSSHEQAAILRNALDQSDRFSDVDIQTISFNNDVKLFDVKIVAAFNEGAAR